MNVAFAPLKATAVTPVRFVPRNTTELFTVPDVGFRLVMPDVGDPSTLARNTAARFVFNVVKKLNPVLVCNWFTLVK